MTFREMAYDRGRRSVEFKIARKLHAWRTTFQTWFEAGAEVWRTHRKNRIDRLAFQQLLMLDDAALRDIGFTREEVNRANRLPLSQNASEELYRRSLSSL